VFLGTLAIVGLGCILMPRYYRASSLVMPSEAALTKPMIPGAMSALEGSDASSRTMDPRMKSEALATIIGLATTDEVRYRAIETLSLDTTPAKLEKLVTVEPYAGTIIRITCLSRTGDGAIKLANTMAHEFAGVHSERVTKQAKSSREFLWQQLYGDKALYDLAKIRYPDSEWTWDQYEEALKQLKQARLREFLKKQLEPGAANRERYEGAGLGDPDDTWTLDDYRQVLKAALGEDGALSVEAEYDVAPSADAAYKKLAKELKDLSENSEEAGLPVGDAENPFLTQFYALAAERDATEARRLEVAGRLRALRVQLAALPPTRESATSTTDNPVASELQGELAKLERDLLLAQTRYTEKHRTIRDLKAQIADLKDRLAQEGDRMITHRTVEPNPVYRRIEEEIVNLQPEWSALASKLSSLEAAIETNKNKAGQLSGSSADLLAKTEETRDAGKWRAELTVMLNRAKQEEDAVSTADEITILSKARSAIGPVAKIGPSRAQLMLLGLVLSLCLGLGAAVALAFLDDRVQVREDLERELQLPVPGVIPALPGGDGGVSVARVTELQPLSPVAEAYRFLKTELVYGTSGTPPQTILIATARPGQGGSTTAVNLAIALAEGGSRVLLVDADMRRPTLHRLFEQTNDAGLTSLLANGGAVAADALRKTGMENLLLLPAGPMVGNPAALLTSERMRRLLQRMREHADYIVIDTPSAATFADATLLASLVDAVVLVTRANQPIRAVERRTKELFQKVGANVIGAVLNEADPNRVDSSYFYGHYYSVPRELPSQTSRASATAEAIGGAGSLSLPSRHESGPQLPAAAGQGREAAAALGRPSHGEADARTQTASAARRPSRRVGRPVVLAAIAVAVIAVAIAALSHFGLLKGRAPEAGEGAAGVAAVAPAADTSPVTVDAFVLRPVNVRVEQDGKLLYDGELAVGPQQWKGAEEVTVWSSDPSALRLTVNDRAIGTLGEAGDHPMGRTFTAADKVAQ